MSHKEQESLTQPPQMTAMAGRPVKVLYQPSGDILVACRTPAGEDVHVHVSALLELFATEIVKRVRIQGGQGYGIHR